MTSNAVVVSDVSKSFRIYRDRNKSIKATVLKGSRAKYDEFWALKDIALEIPQGKTFGLLGNNGSGKSTLLKCIAQILEPNKGLITHVGRMAAMLEVGSGFHPELSGRDNVYLNGAILGMSKAEIDRKFDSIVDFSGSATSSTSRSRTTRPACTCGWASRSQSMSSPTSCWSTRCSLSAT